MPSLHAISQRVWFTGLPAMVSVFAADDLLPNPCDAALELGLCSFLEKANKVVADLVTDILPRVLLLYKINNSLALRNVYLDWYRLGIPLCSILAIQHQPGNSNWLTWSDKTFRSWEPLRISHMIGGDGSETPLCSSVPSSLPNHSPNTEYGIHTYIQRSPDADDFFFFY